MVIKFEFKEMHNMHCISAARESDAASQFCQKRTVCEKYESRRVHKSDSQGEEIGGMGHLMHWLGQSILLLKLTTVKKNE